MPNTGPLPQFTANMAQQRFPIVVSDLTALQDEARYLAQLPPTAVHQDSDDQDAAKLDEAIKQHLKTAQARLTRPRFKMMLGTTLIGSVMAHLHAAESMMLRRGDTDYLMGKLPKIRTDVRNHLAATDPQRISFELLVKDLEKNHATADKKREHLKQPHIREEIISAGIAANMAYRREYGRMLSFHRGLSVWSVVLLILGIGLGLWGVARPTDLAICFSPEGKNVLVCPTNESLLPAADAGTGTGASGTTTEKDDKTGEAVASGNTADSDRDTVIAKTVGKADIFLLIFVGMVGAAITAAGSFRKVGGTATPFNLAIALAFLKLPLGGLTAVFGLLLIRGGFFPGLSDLDSAPQIIAWAVIFGAAQQLFTSMVEKQAKRVQDQVGEIDEPART
ncbi:hypothetical protein GT020_01515 [Glutamicibacter soli]|uniref:Uncharacterized protein n=1 Tax=Glutamicibacter soli TaxID=453836 RepID=A0A6L9G0B8_9MICC|nr:hypothetical protein [Glutamicibacter soli]NAZ14748.1 hypothetical protein [Glutamicibacter soli]